MEARNAPANVEGEPARWLHLLPRLSLFLAVELLALLVVAGGGLGVRDSDLALGQDFAQLLQAVRSPGFYRVFALLDATGWLVIGAFLLTLAGVLRRHAPRRSTFIAALGIGQLIGSLGGFLRLYGISDLAARYATATQAQQVALLASFLDLERVINSLFLMGDLLQGLGWLLVAWAAFSLAGFPRWLAAWFVIPTLGALTLFVVQAAGGPFLVPVLLVAILALIGLQFAMAKVMWRPSPTLLSAVTKS